METEIESGKQAVFLWLWIKRIPHIKFEPNLRLRAGPLCRYFGAYMELLLNVSNFSRNLCLCTGGNPSICSRRFGLISSPMIFFILHSRKVTLL